MFDKAVKWASLTMCLVIVTHLNARLKYSKDDSRGYNGDAYAVMRDTAPPKRQIADFSNILRSRYSLKPQHDGGVSRHSSRREYSNTEDANYRSPIEIPKHIPDIMKDKPFHGNSSMDRPIPDEFLPIRRYASSSKIIISTAKKEESSTTSDDQPLDEQEGKKSHTGAKKHKAGKKFSKKRLMRLKNWKLQ